MLTSSLMEGIGQQAYRRSLSKQIVIPSAATSLGSRDNVSVWQTLISSAATSQGSRGSAALRARLASRARAPRARTFTLLRTRAPQHRAHARAPRARTLAPRRHSTRAALKSSRSHSYFILKYLVTLLPHRVHESTTPHAGQSETPPRINQQQIILATLTNLLKY